MPDQMPQIPTVLPSDISLLIIGGGPAGLAAAVAAWDAGCHDLLIVERDDELGGILNQCIHNGFGLHRFKEELTGPEYAGRYIEMVRQRGIPYVCSAMVLEISMRREVTVISPQTGLSQIRAGAVILAMGCRERPRGALGTPGTRCAGIMTTGTAQRLTNLEGYMPGRRVVILGSGDIGLIMARRMTFEGAEVLACVEIMPYSSGLTRNVVQCLQDFNIPLMLNHTVIDIHGRERLEGVTIAAVNPDTRQPLPETAQRIDCDTLLLSVGLIPENELSRMAGVPLSPSTRGPVVDQTLATEVPGIFACGNVLHVHDLVDEVSEESARAGRAAVEWLNRPGQPLPDHKTRAIPLREDRGVRGLVPQYLQLSEQVAADSDQQWTISFRPDNVYHGGVVLIRADGQMILRRKKMIMTPGEMVVEQLKAADLPDGPIRELTVEVEGVPQHD